MIPTPPSTGRHLAGRHPHVSRHPFEDGRDQVADGDRLSGGVHVIITARLDRIVGQFGARFIDFRDFNHAEAATR
jgi:hypothetical protein